MASPQAAVFIGSDTLLIQCLELWRSRGHQVAAVATDTDKVRDYCGQNGLRCVDATGDLAAELSGQPFDYLFAVTWLQLLAPELLSLPGKAAINFHDGPLPRYAGLNATCWSLLNGETEHGVTWHRIEARADVGDVLVQSKFAVEPRDTAFTLNARCFDHGQRSFAQLCEQLERGELSGLPQDLEQRTYFGRAARPAALAVLDPSLPADEGARLVRAFDHGGYPNPVAVAKLATAGGFLAPTTVELLPASGAPLGEVVAVDAQGVQVAFAGGDLVLQGLRDLEGRSLDAAALAALGLKQGVTLPVATRSQRSEWTSLGAAAAPGEPAWVRALTDARPMSVPEGRPAGPVARPASLPVELGDVGPRRAAALCVAFLLRNQGTLAADVGFACTASDPQTADARALAVTFPPVQPRLAAGSVVGDALQEIERAFDAVATRGPLLRELGLRHPQVAPAALEPPVRVSVGTAREVEPGTMTFAVGDDGVTTLCFDAETLDERAAAGLIARLAVFAHAAQANPSQPLASVPVLDDEELERLLRSWNDTATAPIAEPCLHRQFAAVAARQPDRVALRCGAATLSYAQLSGAVEQLAGHLRARGVQVGDRVGVCTQRGFGMVTAALAVQRCGAAYVPLDPGYPRERLAFMAEDAELAALVVDQKSAAAAPAAACPVVDLDADAAAIAAAGPLAEDLATGDDLAYMIYTSGSTGRPKGVMVRHRNAANFFVGMDAVLGADQPDHEPGTWLAVTSLSFDISVLELFWTLCRGFEVVIYQGSDDASEAPPAASTRPISFSMFYFASDEGEHAEDKYRLLIEGAKFADKNGFEAVWTPERHFHAFGGLYPNPAVASAAIATITENVKIRAGSCVAPLHHPIRIAEDWALVDNLSRGRVGIAFAAGWHGRDFVLRPENFEDRKGALTRTMDQVHALWRGEELDFEGPDGATHKIRTLPRPVQEQLPTWVTVAGNPETYRLAGASGSHVLTHLLGQSLEELDKKLGIYRQAWREAGHEGDGHVTLMLHTFVGEDEDEVRELVREPMKSYLRSSLDLVKQAAWSFPAFKNRVDEPGEMDKLLNGGLTPEDFDALLDFSFERYYQQSGLFGTPESCVAIVDRLRGIKIDEIACLVDFGVGTARVMESLPQLQELKRRCDERSAAAPAEAATAADAAPAESIPALIARHGVTHFQCTPSMAGMLMLDPAAPSAFGGLRHMLVGGEALPSALAAQLVEATPTLHDVYGPTETTVWSTTWRVGDDATVPIGRPLANQQVYVLDDQLQPVATGSAGELWIGGDGVTAGYFKRPELTEEKFRPDPFRAGADAKIYATGDLVRWRDDGVLEYLGRKDLQVKVRGYRIELGEIETALAGHPSVQEVVVVARDDGADARLAAYLVAKDTPPSADALRGHLRDSLPEFMVPSAFVVLPDLPRTPNLKVDRKALPAPEAVQAAGPREVAAAADETEEAILAIWRRSLGTQDVGVEDNFFDSGGHSILAVKVHREIAQQLGVELAVTDLFRFTTVRALAKHLSADSSTPSAAQAASARAKARRSRMRRR